MHPMSEPRTKAVGLTKPVANSLSIGCVIISDYTRASAPASHSSAAMIGNMMR